MSKLYDKLLVPEWRTAISPRGFADSVLQGIRGLTQRIADVVGLTLKHTTHRVGYRTVNIALDEIVYVATPAVGGLYAGDIIAGVVDGTVAGAYPERCNKYRFKWSDPNIDVFGAGLESPMAIRGRDFYVHSGYYWFKKHPAKFGTIGVSGNKHMLSMLCIGGNHVVDTDPLGLPYHSSAEASVRTAVDAAVYGNAPMGVSTKILQAVGGCDLGNTKIANTWTEEDLLIAVTADNKINYAPADGGVALQDGSLPDLSVITTPSDYFVLNLEDHTYVIPLTDDNLVKDFPEVLVRFPGISTNGTTFSGTALLALLQQQGCVFYHWGYIDNNQNKQKVLSSYNIGTGKALVNDVITVHMDLSDIEEEATPTPVFFNMTARCYNCC